MLHRKELLKSTSIFTKAAAAVCWMFETKLIFVSFFVQNADSNVLYFHTHLPRTTAILTVKVSPTSTSILTLPPSITNLHRPSYVLSQPQTTLTSPHPTVTSTFLLNVISMKTTTIKIGLSNSYLGSSLPEQHQHGKKQQLYIFT